MYISRLQLVNYRNFAQADVIFKKGVNTIIGENGSGKTNILRAIRLLLDESMIRMVYRLDEQDFHRGLKDWRGHWLIISLEFSEVSEHESVQSLFLHNAGNIEGGSVGRATYNLLFRPKAAIRQALGKLAPGDLPGLASIRSKIELDDYEPVFTGKSSVNFCDPGVYKAVVGDFENVVFPEGLHDASKIGGIIPGGFSITREISFTFVQALRDVVADFQSNRTNPLLSLLKRKSGEIDPVSFEPISAKVKDLNGAIEALPDVRTVRSDIRETITDAAGETYSPRGLSIRSDLSDEADRLFQSLKLFVAENDELYEGGIHELSLGGANLIYLTLKLLEFKYRSRKESFANFLLIEEPEAHIHTHIQKTLFDRLNYADTQVIYTTHSTHISEVSNVENVNILGRDAGRCEVFQPSRDLKPDEIGNIQRYLDAVRSNLLFARSVLLVEGDAEEILVPILVKKVFGLSLDELGISLINIRSTGFENVAVLFHDRRIRKRCAIITDLDAAFIDVEDGILDLEADTKRKKKAKKAAKVGLERQAALNKLCNGNNWLTPHFADHTFEVDFVKAGNVATVVSVLNDVYKDAPTIALAKKELESGKIEEYGTRVLTMANHVGKGWFAIVLGKAIHPDVKIPDYLLDAIFQAYLPVSKETFAAILTYRLRLIGEAGGDKVELGNMRHQIEQYRLDKLDFAGVRAAMLMAFPADTINAILADF
ncbi:ATP-dependent nuclease [Rhizobium ruizarguesonis]|uniref:ATP-dependent nuclease n=1 Tax=Rhizobium ruizarguesonis TaxID=2081791 RepID=UPI00103D7B07|nr:AAA family ATPase [Rhizobium ruizarguesonis]NEH37246.1 AAA family ATPase [Rhizobium ruizarguesonis]NEJ32666.1 AAA family ATPase [Rhizobium ruizarguesonis]TBY89584.1 DUF2813 domain-containing protein [Rhizobium leguminosarum bv. viciae]TCB46623.1 DUF2813 domain-containing protein [Rhizobium leguminosarum bv. viciae]